MVESAYVEEWASSDHFTVDGTMIESYASMKSLRPQGSEAARVSDGSDDDDQGNPTVNFRGEKRSNRTHRSLTDPEARLARKSKGVGSQLAHAAHVLMENRNGLVVDVSVSEANGRAERQEALTLVRRTRRRHRLRLKTLGADKGYAAGAFLHELESKETIVPMIPMPKGPIRAAGLEADAFCEHPFLVVKRHWGFDKARYRGLAKNAARAYTMFALANLYRVRYRLMPPGATCAP